MRELLNKTYIQLITFGILVIVCSGFFLEIAKIISALIWSEVELSAALQGFSDNVNQINILKMLQAAGHLGAFVMPALILIFLLRKNYSNFIGLSYLPNMFQFIAVSLLFVLSIPIIQLSYTINQSLQLPSFLLELEQLMIQMEDKASVLTSKFLNVNTVGAYLVNIFILAVLPAIGEELLFRGLLMRWFSKFIRNIHFNIIFTAFLFSAIHFQFLGFLPRFFLGIILGYVFVWTSSLWSSIWLHFINNALTVTVYFWVFKNEIGTNPEEVGSVNGWYFYILSAIFIVMILFWLKKNSKNRNFYLLQQ